MSGKKNAAIEYGRNSRQMASQQQANVDRMWAERDKYGSQAEDLLGKSPTYQIPDQVKQYQDLMNSSGNKMAGYADQLKNTDFTAAGQQAMQNAANTYNTSAATLRDIMSKGTQQSADFSAKQLSTGLKDTNSFVDFYRQQASRNEMPGQTALEGKIGRNYSELYKSLGQQGGGSASSLGAMIDAAANKTEALSDIGIQASQYKASQEANLGEALQRAQAVRSDLFSQQANASLSRAGAMAGAEQTAGQMQATGQENLANFSLNRQSAAQNSIMGQADLISQQANMQGQGLQMGAQYADQAYQNNELMPYQNTLNYYMSQLGSLNPYQAQSDAYNTQLNSMNNAFSLFGKKGRFSL